MTRTVFTGGLLYDGTLAPPAPGDMVIEGGRIVSLGAAGSLDGDESIDTTGRTVSPGFIDCHVHVMMTRPDTLTALNTPFSLPFYQAAHNLRATLDTGITSVRDAGGADRGVREAVQRGLIAGPRMQIAISMLSQTGGTATPGRPAVVRPACSRPTRADPAGWWTARRRFARRCAS